MTLPDLAAIVRAAQSEDLPGLVGRFAEAQAVALARLATPMTVPKDTEPERLLTPDQAAEIATVPVERIYSWARGAKWAQRPSRRCLRVAEGAFRRWLRSRA